MMSDNDAHYDIAATEMECTRIISPSVTPTSHFFEDARSLETDTTVSPTTTAAAALYAADKNSRTYLNTATSMLGLKMRLQAPRDFLSDYELQNLADRINVMRTQEETTYKVYDYVQRRACEDTCMRTTSRMFDGTVRTDTVDKSIQCREKMVEWSFHIVDHFNLSREIVEIAFSYLDRFLDRCSCDKTVFKLASMTCLYIASKNTGPKYVAISTLSELSEGEFDANHFIRMEKIVLNTLDWRIQPPTTRAFIDHFIALLPRNKIAMKQAILRRAAFFSELSVFDYFAVTERRSLIALGSVLNAIHDIYHSKMSEALSKELIGELCTLKMEFRNVELDAVQERLQYLFRDSEQYRVFEASKLRMLGAVATSCVCASESSKQFPANLDDSPVSVLVERYEI
mmetsp:Transcript_10990/g.24598  ORF Transcript_10990/g.24598 Transcript_10990/m.24598 type:complete len:400 (+) Transcript_10990:106-1305(+)